MGAAGDEIIPSELLQQLEVRLRRDRHARKVQTLALPKLVRDMVGAHPSTGIAKKTMVGTHQPSQMDDLVAEMLLQEETVGRRNALLANHGGHVNALPAEIRRELEDDMANVKAQEERLEQIQHSLDTSASSMFESTINDRHVQKGTRQHKAFVPCKAEDSTTHNLYSKIEKVDEHLNVWGGGPNALYNEDGIISPK